MESYRPVRRESMSAVDAAWLRMDSSVQHMVITSLLRFREVVTYAEVERLVRERVLEQPRFRQRVVESSLPLGMPQWEIDPHFDLSVHLHDVSLPSPGDDAALAAWLSDLASTPLDRDRPLWNAYVVGGLEEGSALVVRLHHAIGDGITLVRMLLSLTDEHATAEPASVGLPLPDRPAASTDLARLAASHTMALGRMLLLPTDPKTPFRGPLGRSKGIAWTKPFALDALKSEAHALGATLNDVLIAVTAGAIRRRLLATTGVERELELRALVPVFFRGHAEEGGLGNHFGLVFAPLLVGVEDVRERIRLEKARLDAVKGSPDAIVALEVLMLMGVASAEIESIGIDIFTRKASFMITNVPGPRTALHLVGHEVSDMIVWAPVSGHISTGLSLVSYDGRVRLGICADRHLVPDPAAIARAFEEEVETLLGA